jgi:hypothetical protein
MVRCNMQEVNHFQRKKLLSSIALAEAQAMHTPPGALLLSTVASYGR